MNLPEIPTRQASSRLFLFCLVGLLFILPAVQADRAFSYSEAGGNLDNLGNSACEGIGTLFKFQGSNMDAFAFHLNSKTGTPEHIVTPQMHTGAATPGTVACQGTPRNMTTFGENGYENFSFSGCTLSDNTDYWAVLNITTDASTAEFQGVTGVGDGTNFSVFTGCTGWGAAGNFMTNLRVYNNSIVASSPQVSVDPIGPTDNYHTANASSSVVITYNTTENHMDDGAIDCALFINTTATDVFINISEDTSPNINGTDTFTGLNDFANETNYTYYVECSDGTDSGNSTQQSFIIDRTNPLYAALTGMPISDGGYVDSLSNNTLKLKYSWTDTYMWGIEYNITSQNGSVELSDSITGLTAVDYNATNESLNMKFWLNGTYIFESAGEDDHTAAWWDTSMDTIISQTSNSITFNTPEGAVCTIEAAEANLKGLTWAKLQDRYTWSFEKNSAKTEHGIDLKCNKAMHLREHYDYPAWVVGKNWLDLNVGDASYAITEHDVDHWTITITTPEATDTLDFNSLGGLNRATITHSFRVDPIPTQIAAIDYTINTANVTFNWTNPGEGETYEIYRNGTNIANISDGDTNYTDTFPAGSEHTWAVYNANNDTTPWSVNTTTGAGNSFSNTLNNITLTAVSDTEGNAISGNFNFTIGAQTIEGALPLDLQILNHTNYLVNITQEDNYFEELYTRNYTVDTNITGTLGNTWIRYNTTPGNATIYPSCTYNGSSIGSNGQHYTFANGNYSITCAGGASYAPLTWELNKTTTLHNETVEMTAYYITIQFNQSTETIIHWSAAGSSNYSRNYTGSTGLISILSSTFPDDAIIHIEFNIDESENATARQYFDFLNDYGSSVIENVNVEDTLDQFQRIKVESYAGETLDGATITVYDLGDDVSSVTNPNITNQIITDSTAGDAHGGEPLWIDSSKAYAFEIKRTGYQTQNYSIHASSFDSDEPWIIKLVPIDYTVVNRYWLWGPATHYNQTNMTYYFNSRESGAYRYITSYQGGTPAGTPLNSFTVSNGGGSFNLVRNTHYQDQNFTLSIYIYNTTNGAYSLVKTQTIRSTTYDVKAPVTDLGLTSRASGVINALLWVILILAAAMIGNMITTEGGGDIGFAVFSIGAVVIAFISSTFIPVAAIGILGWAAASLFAVTRD